MKIDISICDSNYNCLYVINMLLDKVQKLEET